MRVSRYGRISGAGGCPGVRAGIVSPASVEEVEAVILSAPDNHLTAGPNCRVRVSRSGRISGAGGCPGVIDAPIRVGNLRKNISSYA